MTFLYADLSNVPPNLNDLIVPEFVQILQTVQRITIYLPS